MGGSDVGILLQFNGFNKSYKIFVLRKKGSKTKERI